ncbi:hypothetical protein RCF98_01360 [Thiothrix lacustris]|uniref:Uncharacterized protein n=1 Tax=Thiothrix lacustris TaxID=525917 RepID=A0ABY9MQT0_9GAMM|nr:hypothetical protein [Thiothrix lacustris]WML91014.1 hypothetical protein RCF98_01360 [Thiothrix lacustris]
MTMDNSQDALLKLGFKFGKNGAHAARSMMIEELKQLFASRPKTASQEDYQQDIVTFNTLHKATENSRKLTYHHLKDLYGLSPDIPLFNVLRQWWELSETAQVVLALQLAVARDPLLRGSVPVVLALQPGEHLARSDMEAYLCADDPERFSPASLKSFAQNINGTWTQAGYLTGRTKKYRSVSAITYVNVAFALFLAHCQGLSGQRMFHSEWCRLLALNTHELYDMAHAASLRGLLNFKHASEVVEVTFPHLQVTGQR